MSTQLQYRGGNDAERALGADENVLEVVAGVVLSKAAQAVPYAAIRKHDFEPEDLLASVAVAKHIYAPGVRREDASDLAAALGCERHGEIAPRALGRLLHVGKDAPASATRLSSSGSTWRMRFILASESTISRRPPTGTEPPERPVFPP
jgi:hypothetical protein